jgi:hypothetical protein
VVAEAAGVVRAAGAGAGGGGAVAAKKASGQAPDTLEVIDVAQLLARSITPANGASAGPEASSAGDDQQGAAGDLLP